MKAPLVVAYGMGVDSTAMLIGMKHRGIRPDLILFADTGDEKKETYAYQKVIDRWLKRVGFPPVITVRYQVKNFKNWPPYYTLGQNCLTNGTLPSLAFGFKSCSMTRRCRRCAMPARRCSDRYPGSRLSRYCSVGHRAGQAPAALPSRRNCR